MHYRHVHGHEAGHDLYIEALSLDSMQYNIINLCAHPKTDANARKPQFGCCDVADSMQRPCWVYGCFAQEWAVYVTRAVEHGCYMQRTHPHRLVKDVESRPNTYPAAMSSRLYCMSAISAYVAVGEQGDVMCVGVVITHRMAAAREPYRRKAYIGGLWHLKNVQDFTQSGDYYQQMMILTRHL